MLLARRVLRVLLLDRDPAQGLDTLSTHALLRAGVLQLERWGLLRRVVEANTPALRSTSIHYGNDPGRAQESFRRMTVRSACG